METERKGKRRNEGKEGGEGGQGRKLPTEVGKVGE